jgi:hypothetical protein
MKCIFQNAATVLVWIVIIWPRIGITQEDHSPAAMGFVKGFTWGWVGQRGAYQGVAAADSMKKLAGTTCECICLAFGTSMKTFDTPEIPYGDKNSTMVTDDEIRRAIDLAQAGGMKVILKPVVNCDDNTWRAWIRFFRPISDDERAKGISGEMDRWSAKPKMREGEVKDLEKWDRWWNDFEGFVIHYAKIAEEQHVSALCLGCEMNSTEEFEEHWRKLIRDVRKVYGGLITYDVNHGNENNPQWWDAVDFISVSAYYPVPPRGGQSIAEAVQQTTPVDEIVQALQGPKKQLKQLSAKWHKSILFIETGVTNVRGCARYPWAHIDEHLDSPLDETEQANYYEAFFQVFWDEPWNMGFTWWEWPPRLYDPSGAAQDRSFSIFGKQAEGVVRRWYAKPHDAPISQ